MHLINYIPKYLCKHLCILCMYGYLNDSINQSKFIQCPFKIPTRRRPRPRPSGKEQSWEGGGIENKHHLVGALGLLEVHSRLLDQPPKRNLSAIVAERANGTTKLPWTENSSVQLPAQEERGRQSSRRWEGAQPDRHHHTKDTTLYYHICIAYPCKIHIKCANKQVWEEKVWKQCSHTFPLKKALSFIDSEQWPLRKAYVRHKPLTGRPT